MKKVVILLLVSFFFFSCEKEKIVEIEKEVEVEVPANPLKVLNKLIMERGDSNYSYYERIVAKMKQFASQQGADSYGYFYYYGPYNFDSNYVERDDNTFLLCIVNGSIKDVYGFDWSAEISTNNNIHSNEIRPILTPKNVDFYKNKFCGFITRAELLAL